MINPPWISENEKKSKQKTITIDDFKNLKFSKNLMTDGLVFIWVEKEILSPLIKYFESQEMIYVENVCWIMLD